MHLILKKRQEGVTTRLVNWLKKDVENRLLVVHNEQMATSIRIYFGLPNDTVMSYARYKRLRGTRPKDIAFDEYQLFVERDENLNDCVKIVSITVED
jgi:hypothetical protein